MRKNKSERGEKFRAEMDKLRKMTPGERAAYIWEYYKYPIIIAAAAVFVVGSLLNALVFNPAPKSWLGLAVNDVYVGDKIETLKKRLDDMILPEDAVGYEVKAENFFYNEGRPEETAALMQKFTAMIALRELDIIIALESSIKELADKEYILPLTYLAETYGWEASPDGALNLKDNAFFASLGIYADGLYMACIANSANVERAEDAILKIMGWELNAR